MNGPTFAAPPAAKPAARPAPARPPARPDPDAPAGPRLLTSLKLHGLMILFCGTLLGGAGAYAAWELLPAKYESNALLQVDQTPFTLAAAAGPNQARTEFPTYVKTAIALLGSEFVHNAALKQQGVADLPTLKAQKDPIKFLAENVRVNAPDGSEVIRLSMEGHHPEDVRRIVDAVQKAFMAEVMQEETKRKQQVRMKIEQAQEDTRKRLEGKAKKGELARGGADPAVKAAAGGGTAAEPGPLPNPRAGDPLPPDVLGLLATYNPRALFDKMGQLNDEIEVQLPAHLRAARERLKEIDARLAALRGIVVDEDALKAADGDPGVRGQAELTVSAKARSSRSPGNDTLKAIAQAQADVLEKMRRDKAVSLEKEKREPEVKALFVDKEQVKARIQALEARQKEAAAQLAKVGRRVADLPPPTAAEARVVAAGGDRVGPAYDPEQTAVSSQDGIYFGLVRNQMMAELELNAPPRVRDIQKASAPMQKDSKKQIMATVAAGLFGYVLIALGAIGFETLGRRVSSLADAKAASPAPVVGVVPYGPADKDPVKHRAALDGVDKLREYVAQTWLGRGASCVAVTSPLGDEGKAFAAFGLATSLAQAGYKTLLADFDLRDPAVHVQAAVANEVGVCEVLRGELDAREAVVGLPSGLDFVPAGQWTEETRRAAVGSRLDALLAVLKAPYDCVVLHAHSLLTAAEAVEVARRCEAVLVCAKYRETTAPLLRKATDRVAAMEVPFAGVVYVGATEAEALC